MKKILLLAAVLPVGWQSLAATFTADFNTGTVPAGSSVTGTAAVNAVGGYTNSGGLRLTENVGGQVGAWLINDFSAGAAISAFTASFKAEIGPAAGADGFSFNWGTNLTGTGFIEEGDGTGLTVAFDTFDNGGGEAPAIDIKWKGSVVAHSAVPFNFSAAYAAFVTVQVTLTNGAVTVIWNGTTVHSNVGLVGFGSFSGAKFGLGGRTGGSAERHYIDDVLITTTSGSGSSSSFALRKALETDADANGKTNPGDVLRYTISLTNTFGTNLLNSVLTDTNYPNQTLVGGSLKATPLARADAPPANSAPGNAFHGSLNTTLSVAAGVGLLANDFLGLPAAQIASFGGGSFPGTVTTTAAGATSVASGVGSLTVNADGSLTLTPNATFNGLCTFQYRLTNSSGFSDATATLAIGIRPSATNDSFNVTGNTMLDSSLIPQTLLVNDAGSLIGVSANIVPAHGTVSVTTTGNFTYTPAAAYTGADSFTYTITNGFGAVSGTVNLTVANRIWYIDNSVVANGDGRSSSPFKQTSDFTAVNDGAAGHPVDTDRIFLRQGTGDYTGSTTLRSAQRFIGDGAVGTFATHFGFSLAPGSAKAAGVAVPAITGTRPFISVASGTGISLNSDNWVQGLNVNSASGRAVSGASVGFLILSNVTASATGDRVLNIVSGSVIARFDSASSTNSVDNGIMLSALGGGVTINGGFITGAAGNDFALSDSAASVTFAGGINNTAARSVAISNQLGGTVTLSGNITDTGTGLIVQNCTGGTFTFSGASKSFNTAGNPAVTLTNNGSATFTFSNGGLAVTTTTGNAFQALGSHGAITVSGTGNTITSGSGTTFVNTGGANGTVDINAPLTGTGRLIDIENRTGGNVTLSGNLNNNPGTGMLIQNNSGGGIIALSGTTKAFNAGANTAVNFANNTGTTIDFTGGGLALTTTTGTGFNATGGGTISVQGSGNTISAGNGTALNVVSTTIGTSGLTFQSITAGTAGSGPTSGIVLNNTGTGGLTVTGTGSAGTGGTIQKTTGAGISLTSAGTVSLSFMNILNSAAQGIAGTSVNDFSLTNCSVTGNAGTGTASVYLIDTTGAVTFANDNVSGTTGVNGFNVQVGTSPSSAAAITTLTVTGGTYNSSSQNGGFLVNLAHNSSLGTALFTGVTFSNNFSKGLQLQQNDNAVLGNGVGAPATGTITITNCSFYTNNVACSMEGGGGTSGTGSAYFRFVNNTNILWSHSVAVNFANGSDSGGGTYKALASGNRIGINNVPNSGSAIGDGIRVFMQGQQTATVTITNNFVRALYNGVNGFGSRGIDVAELGRPNAGFGQTRFDIQIVKNDVDAQFTSFPLYAIYVGADAQGTGTSGSDVRAEIHDNTVPNIDGCDTMCSGTAMLVYEKVVGATGTEVAALYRAGFADTTVNALLANHNAGTAGRTTTQGSITITTTPVSTVP